MAAQAEFAQWWQRVFDASEDAQVICTTDGSIVLSNRKADRFFVLSSAGPMEGTNLFDLAAPPGPQQIRALVHRRSDRQETVPTVTYPLPGRPTLIADLHITRLSDELLHVHLKDISQRHRLEFHSQRLVSAIDATPDIFFLTDAEFRITFVNPAFQTITGYSIENVLGRTSDFLRSPGEQAKIREYQAAVQAGADWQGELINVRSNGAAFPVEASISPIYDRAGQFLGLSACERDLTQRKRIESELLHGRNFAVSILQSIDSAVYALNRELRLTHFNEGWRRFPPQHGWLSLEQPPNKGHLFLDYVAESGRRSELRELFELILQTGESHELEAASADGQFHWMVRISPWNHQRGVIGLLYQVSDQSRLHRLQNQLIQSQKMELVGALAAGIAHDFNNLLTAVRGNATLALMEEALSDAVRLNLQHIDRAAMRAAEITRHLLTFSRARDEQLEVLDFNQVIREASNLAQRSLPGSVKLQLQPLPEPVKVRMDATRANQLLLNLCVNAADAMPSGGTLTISNEIVSLTPEKRRKCPCPPESAILCCTVADTGKGIPPEILSRVFEPFFTTKAQGAGTGLGLAIVQQVVNEAGGFIDVETACGAGTKFHIHLPTVEGVMLSSIGPEMSQLHKGSGRILVVEDSELVRHFAESFLTVAGYEVKVASNAQEALKHLESERVDLMLTDYDMPGMNGLELIKEVAPRWPETKLVLASGYLEFARQQELVENFGCRILKKPYNVEKATSLVAEILTKAE